MRAQTDFEILSNAPPMARLSTEVFTGALFVAQIDFKNRICVHLWPEKGDAQIPVEVNEGQLEPIRARRPKFWPFRNNFLHTHPPVCHGSVWPAMKNRLINGWICGKS